MPIWTNEIFIIHSRYYDAVNPNILKYKIKSLQGTVFARKYYHHELLKIAK